MSLGFTIKEEREDDNPEASNSSHEPTTPELPPTGASINPEMVEEQVEIAKIVEPEIAKAAQEAQDEEKAQNEQDELKAQADLKEQEARKSAAQKQQEESLQAAKDKLRQHAVVTLDGEVAKITETSEERVQRLKDEERSRLNAESMSKYVQEQLAEAAAAAITPKLDSIHKIAQAQLDKRAAELAALAEKAQQHKQENEAHRSEVEQKAQLLQEKQHADEHMFTHGDGQDHGVKASASSLQVEKLMALQSQLEQGDPAKFAVDPAKKPTVIEQAAHYQNNLEVSTKLNAVDKPEPTKSNVAALVTAFETSREQEPKKETEPRRTGRIAELVKQREAKMTTTVGTRTKASATRFAKK